MLRVSDDDVKVQPDVCVDGRCGEADGVVSRFLCGKGELAVCRAPRPNDVVAGVDVLDIEGQMSRGTTEVRSGHAPLRPPG